MFVRGAVPALLIAAMLAGGMWAWWLSGRRFRRPRLRSRYRLEAQEALWRHPAGRGRWPGPGDPMSPGPGAPPARPPIGPDDDPDFIHTLEQLIRGDDQGTGA